MSREFDSRKDSQSKKFEQMPQIFIKLSLRDLCDSKLSGLHAFDNMAILQTLNWEKSRKVGCKFMRHQFLK